LDFSFIAEENIMNITTDQYQCLNALNSWWRKYNHQIIDIDAIYTSSIQSLDREFNVDEVTLQGCEFIVDDYGSSFTVIKVVTYENIEGNELNQVHYLLPLFHHDVGLANKVTYALHVSGNGECEFLRLPMIESGDTYAIDSRELVNKLLETKAYSMWFMNLIQHKKLLVVPKEDFAVQLARLGIVNFIPAQGLGVYLDNQNIWQDCYAITYG